MRFDWSPSVFSKRYEARQWREQCGLTVFKLWEFTVCASYIVFLFVNNENNNFIKEIKHVVCAFIASWNPRQSLWEFSSRWKPLTASWVFTDLLLNSPKRSPQFSPVYEGMQNMFYFLNKISVSCCSGQSKSQMSTLYL